MLKKFKVRNFKNFRDEMEWDFSNVKNYEFGGQLIRNGILKNAIVYGRNAAGKSNLGFAIFDITQHLTDTAQKTQKYRPYLNFNSNDRLVYFEYTFCFGENVLVYCYEKEETRKILREKILINNRQVLLADKDCSPVIDLKGAEQLNLKLWDGSISLVKYVAKNTILDTSDKACWTFMQFIDFVNRMIWFSSVAGNQYIGYSNMSGSICGSIIELNAVKEFQEFLLEMGIELQLVAKDDGEEKNLYCICKNKMVLLQDIWSSGTRSLAFLFLWYKQMEEMSFVFIDEFDAFYHYELAEAVVRKLLEMDAQIIFTSHNTDLLTNDLLRPDCYFELRDNQIKSFSDRTSKALRQAHNIQKMYKAGAFDER